MFALRRIKSQKAEVLKEHGIFFTNYTLFGKRTGSGESIFVRKKYFKSKPAHSFTYQSWNASYYSHFRTFYVILMMHLNHRKDTPGFVTWRGKLPVASISVEFSCKHKVLLFYSSVQTLVIIHNL